MKIVSQRFESHAADRTGESIGSWHVPTISVDTVLRSLRVAFWLGVDHKPFHIHHNVLPTVRFQMLRKPLRIRFHLFLVDCRSVAVPTIPTHRWRSREQRRVGVRRISRLMLCHRGGKRPANFWLGCGAYAEQRDHDQPQKHRGATAPCRHRHLHETGLHQQTRVAGGRNI